MPSPVGAGSAIHHNGSAQSGAQDGSASGPSQRALPALASGVVAPHLHRSAWAQHDTREPPALELFTSALQTVLEEALDELPRALVLLCPCLLFCSLMSGLCAALAALGGLRLTEGYLYGTLLVGLLLVLEVLSKSLFYRRYSSRRRQEDRAEAEGKKGKGK